MNYDNSPNAPCQISMVVDMFSRLFAGDSKKLPVPNGAPCEVEGCGKKSIWILKRRIQRTGMLGSDTDFDPESPCHPRCADHLGPGDAWVIDGLDPKVSVTGAMKGKKR